MRISGNTTGNFRTRKGDFRDELDPKLYEGVSSGLLFNIGVDEIPGEDADQDDFTVIGTLGSMANRVGIIWKRSPTKRSRI
jgi:hypothetical protein